MSAKDFQLVNKLPKPQHTILLSLYSSLRPPAMAFRLTSPFGSPLSIGIGLSAAYATSRLLLSRPRGSYRLACDNGTSSIGINEWPVSREAQTPVLRKGRLNPGAVRQMSSGSILGQFVAASLVEVRW
jgi:hypothetical protein